MTAAPLHKVLQQHCQAAEPGRLGLASIRGAAPRFNSSPVRSTAASLYPRVNTALRSSINGSAQATMSR